MEEIKTGWLSFEDAAKVAGMSRANIYYYVSKYPDEIRTRYIRARRQIRIEDLLAVKQRGTK